MTRADLHRLIDELPDASVAVVTVLLERATDPELAALAAAPFDDEPYTEEERAEDAAALGAIDRGEGVPWEEVKAELDTTG